KGSALHAGDEGTVSRCTLNTRVGLPRTASNEIAPSPWSCSVHRNPGSCAWMYSKIPVPIALGGLRVSKETSFSRCPSTRDSSRSPETPIPCSLFPVPALAIDLGPQRAAHPEQLDEALCLLHAPVGGLRVGRAGGVEDVRRTHRDRFHAPAVGLQHDLAVDHALRRGQERLEVRLQRIVVEALVHQLHPLARDVRLEAVLLLAQHRLLQ